MDKFKAKIQRKLRVRASARRLASDRPRLSVNRTSKHIYAQVIDDSRGHTLAAASSLDKGFREGSKSGCDKAAAREIGRMVGERAIAAGVKQVRFDRGGFPFHGRVSAVAEGAREAGLDF